MNVYSNGINKYYKKPNDTGQVLYQRNSIQVRFCLLNVLPKTICFFRAFAFFNCIEPCGFNLTNTQ